MAVIRQRKTKKGEKRYQAFIRIKGFSPVMKTFYSYEDAQLWAKDIEVKMKKGIYKEVPVACEENENKLIYMKDLILYFQTKEAPARYADAVKYNAMFDWWIDKIGCFKIKELETHNLTYYKQILMTEEIVKSGEKQVRKDNTINKYLMCISAILTYAVDELNLININPMSKVKLLKKPNGRTRFLSLKEIKLLLDACKKHSDAVYLFVIIALSTGGRYSEVLNLKINNIDFQNGQVFYLNTKNNEHRGVPISQDISELLKNYIEKNEIEDNIFVNKKTGKFFYMRETLRIIIKNIGLKDFHIHDIRHTTASYIAMNGGSLLDIAEILGHKSLVMARRYSHLTQKHTASVLNKVTNKIIPEV